MFTWRSECHVISALLCGKRCSLFSLYVLECSLSCLEYRYLSALFIHPHSKMCYKNFTSWFPDRSFALFCISFQISCLSDHHCVRVCVFVRGVPCFPVAELRCSCWICWEFSSFSSCQWEGIFDHNCHRVLDTGKLHLKYLELAGKINKSN